VIDEAAIAERYRLLSEGGVLDERRRRLWAAAEASSHGFGGIRAVARATGLHEETIRRGVRELESGEVIEEGRVRRRGAGNKPVSETHPGIEQELERLVAPETRGDPCSPLRWTSKSAAKLARALGERGYEVSDRTVLRLLKRLGYSLQANQKTREGADHPDRDAQFQHINDTVTKAIERREPVISVDTKKRELVGDFKAVGR
jgi:transposase